jgi:hypothetical protein
VIDATMRSKLAARTHVEMRFVGKQAAVAVNVRVEDAGDCVGVQMVSNV